jgi:hypothetical protein
MKKETGNYFDGLGQMFESLMEMTRKNAEMAQENALAISNTSVGLDKVVGVINATIVPLQEDVRTTTLQISEMKQDIEDLKENEEVTTTQQEKIISAARRRVYEILGDNHETTAKYYRVFIQKLYGDARKKAGLGSKIARTRKGDYQEVMNYIETWTPACGCDSLKEYADKVAAARRAAKEEGYVG